LTTTITYKDHQSGRTETAEIDLLTAAATIFGPAGWAYLFVSDSSRNKNACEEALRIASEGSPETNTKSSKAKEQKATKDNKKNGLGSKIKELFSKPNN
jgi:hypothetical protein